MTWLVIKQCKSIWTAAHAIQRNFTNTSTIKAAIEDSQLKEFAEDIIDYGDKEFETFHRNQLLFI